MPDYNVYVAESFEYQKPVLDKDLTTPPTPTKGNRYLVPSGASGDWSTKADYIAIGTGSTWSYITPKEGMLLYIKDEDKYYKYISSWTEYVGQTGPTGPTGPQGEGTGQSFWFHHDGSDLGGGYEGLMRIPANSSQDDEAITCTLANTEYLVDAYATVANVPGITALPVGLWSFHCYHYVNNQGGDSRIVYRVYKRLADSPYTETELFNVTSVEINATTATEYITTHTVTSTIEMNSTDRIIVKIYVKSDTAGRILHFVYEGTTNVSYVTTPFGVQGVIGPTGPTGSIGPTGATGPTGVANLDGSLGFLIDGAGSTITTGIKGEIQVPFDCTIQSVTLLADQSGSIVVDIWKDTYANYPPTDADSITASAVPTITSAIKSTDATLTGWTTSISEGDILRYNVDSCTTITRILITLKVIKS